MYFPLASGGHYIVVKLVKTTQLYVTAKHGGTAALDNALLQSGISFH